MQGYREYTFRPEKREMKIKQEKKQRERSSTVHSCACEQSAARKAAGRPRSVEKKKHKSYACFQVKKKKEITGFTK